MVRRQMTKGTIAMLYPEPDKRGRGNRGKSAETSDFSQKRLSQARTILAFAPGLTELVARRHRAAGRRAGAGLKRQGRPKSLLPTKTSKTYPHCQHS
jgi:hypothetical protein